MKDKPLFQKVRISVYVPESTIAASVSIKEAGSNSYTIVPYNKTGKDYICSVSKSGVHTIRVEADGYETQKRRIRFPFQEKRIYFQLSPPGTKYTYFNGIKVPRPEINFDEPIIIPNGKKKRGGFKKDLSNAELLSELSGIIQDSSTKKKKSEFINPLHFDQKLSKKERGQKLEKLRQHPEVAAVGFKTSLNNGNVAILCNEISIGFLPTVSKDKIKEIIANYPIEHYEKLPFGANYYQLYCKDTIGEEIHDVVEDLNLLDEVDFANLYFLEPAENHSIDPDNFHWGAQWDKHLMGLGSAWDKLNTAFGDSKKFGDREITVTVIDRGIKTSSGQADNISFQDIEGSTPSGTLSSSIVPPGTTIMVKNVAGFTVGDEIKIGIEDGLIVNAISGNDLGISFLRFDHPESSEVVNLTNPGTPTFLSEDAAASFSELTVSITDPGFSVGAVLSIGDLTSDGWEDVLIKEVYGSTIRTTPVRKNHASGALIMQGRKLHRVFDFNNLADDAHFGPDNDFIEDDHGIACASIVLGNAGIDNGVAGMAPNTRLIGIRTSSYYSPGAPDNISPLGVLGEFSWSAGINDYTYLGPGTVSNPPSRLIKGTDVISCSIGFGASANFSVDGGSNLSKTIISALNKLVRRGRNGRGLPVFLSAGNDSQAMTSSQWAGHPYIMAIAASKYEYDSDHTPPLYETLASYSNYSDIGANPKIKLAFAAPAGEGGVNDQGNPRMLGTIAASEKGTGNLINKQDNQTTITTDFIVPRTQLDGNHSGTIGTPLTQITLIPGTDLGKFPNNSWIKVGDLENNSVFVKITNRDELHNKLMISPGLKSNYADLTVVSLIPGGSYIKYSLLPNATEIVVYDASGFKAGDMVRVGQYGHDIMWLKLSSVDYTQKTLNIDTTETPITDLFQCWGPHDRYEDQNLLAYSTSSGSDTIQINIYDENFGSFLARGELIKITTVSGDSWHAIDDHSPGTIVSGKAMCKLSISPSLSASVNSSAAILAPKQNGNPYVMGSSEITVDDHSGFSPGWAFIGTPGDGSDPVNPRLEATYINEIITTDLGVKKLRISGPLTSDHPQNTVISQSSAHDFQNSFNGTSAATPQVAGLAALLLSANPNLTWVETRDIMMQAAEQIGGGTYSNLGGGYKYNDLYGFGRINADAAVEKALELLAENTRDLYVRDYLVFNADGTVSEDDGITETDLSQYKIQSPDIWTRREIAHENGTSPMPQETDYSLILPPNENATINGDRMIYIRIKNRSESQESLQAWLRVYLILTSGLPDVCFPQYFDDEVGPDDYANDKTGVYFINENKLFQDEDVDGDGNPDVDVDGDGIIDYNYGPYTLHKYGGIKNSTSLNDPFGPIVTWVKWEDNIQPPIGTHKHTYIAAEVLPYDGPLADPQVNRNSNISYRRALFTEVEFLKNITGDVALDKVIKYDSSSPGMPFKITVRDVEYLPIKHIVLTIEYTTNLGVKNEVQFKHTGSSFEVIGDRLTMDAPTTISGSPDTFVFTGEFALTSDIVKVDFGIRVMEPDVAEQDPTAPLNPLVIRDENHFEVTVYSIPDYALNPDDGMAPAKTPAPFIFTDFEKLADQTLLEKAFYNTDANNYHISSLFKVQTPGDTVNAYAVSTGQVFIQKADNNRVNLILRPFEQSGLGANKVKYFVYRGLKLTDFLSGPNDPQDKQVRARTDASEFIESLYADIDNRNNATSPVGTFTLSPKAFGYDPENQTNSAFELDDYFFNPDADHQLAIATKGMVLGTFVNDGTLEFGFEIVLEKGSFVPDLAYARSTDFSLTIPTEYGVWKKRLEKEKILSFMDPAAYIGNHYYTGIQKTTSGLIDTTSLYNDIVAKFRTKNFLYLDIRNSLNQSYYFEKNYLVEYQPLNKIMDLKRLDKNGNYQPLSSVPNEDSYTDFEWPVLSFTSANTKDAENGFLFFKLSVADNTSPILYIQNGVVITPKTNERFINTDLLFNIEDASFTKPVGFLCPLISDSSSRFVAGQIQLHYGRNLPTGIDPENRALKHEVYSDNVFGSLESTLQKREIVSIDSSTRTITLNKDYSNSVKVGDVIKIEGAADVTNNKIYTVFSVNYNSGTAETSVVVNETISDTTSPFGKLVFTYHLWNTALPSKWYSGTRRMFIDTTKAPLDTTDTPVLGFSCMADSGLAFDNERVIFFASPVHYLKRNETRAVKQVNLNGGLDTSNSFWVAISNLNKNLRLSSTVLKLSVDDYLPLFEFEQTDEETQVEKKENFLALCITETEFNQVKRALFESSMNNFHDHFLRIKQDAEETDANGIEYIRYTLFINGWIGEEEGSMSYFEVNTCTSIDDTPVYVYSLKSNPLVFSSMDFSSIEVPEFDDKKYDEQLITDSEALSMLALSVNITDIVSDFKTEWDTLTDDNSQLEELIKTTSLDLLETAIAESSVYDDRSLYWARLHIRTAIRAHNWTRKQRKLARDLIQFSESWSRGIKGIDFSSSNPAFSSVNISAAKKILVLGFDPLSINKNSNNITESSASAIVAMNLHNEIIEGTNTGIIQTVLLSGRYNDYESSDLQQLLTDSISGENNVGMIIILGDNVNPNQFDIDRFAVKAVGQTVDNELVRKKAISGGGNPYYSTNLPISDMISLSDSPRVYYDQSFQFSGSSQGHPTEGGPDLNINSTTTPIGKAVNGSGGNLLPNFYFYNLLRTMEKKGSSTKIGLMSLPKPGSAWSGYITIINRLKSILEQAVDHI